MDAVRIDRLDEALAPLFGTRQPGAHRCRRTLAINGRTAYGGYEVAGCTCGKVFRRNLTNRWRLAPADWRKEMGI